MSRKGTNLVDIFQLLVSLKNEANKVQAPGGSNFVLFLKGKLKLSKVSVYQKINTLEKLGYLSKQFDGREIFSIKLLKTEWQEPVVLKERKIKKAQAKRSEIVSSMSVSRRFAILMDFENLEKNIERTRLRDFSWLLDPILEKGKISSAFVFIPDHYGTNPPVRTLSNIHRFFCVFCPKKTGAAGEKDRDSVDARMDELGRFLTEHSDITDIVLVTGDSDFQGLIQFARWQQKRVKLVSAHEAISGRLLFDETLEKQLV